MPNIGGYGETPQTPLQGHTFRVNRTTWVSQYQKGTTNLDFTEARDSECQWHPLGHMQVCTLLQTDNHASTPPPSFFTGRMPFLPPNQVSKHWRHIKTNTTSFHIKMFQTKGHGVNPGRHYFCRPMQTLNTMCSNGKQQCPFPPEFGGGWRNDEASE